MKPLLPLFALFVSLGAPAAQPGAHTEVERGRYLINSAGCMDCHTPLKNGPHGPQPDASRAYSGHPQDLSLPAPPALPPGPWMVVVAATNTAWAGPWGVSFTANLTPDPETGLGNWSAQDFINTLRKGRHLGVGRPLLPPMPASFGQMTDQDLKAMFAYLKSLPPIRNRVPAPLPPVAR